LKKESSKEIQGPAKYALYYQWTPLRRAVGTPNYPEGHNVEVHASC